MLQTVELCGSAGVGKSVLLRYLAHHPEVNSVQHFPDGLVYYRLYPQQSVEDVQQMLFEAFYESDRSFKPSGNRIQQDLHKKNALVVLDNAQLSREDFPALVTSFAGLSSWLIVPMFTSSPPVGITSSQTIVPTSTPTPTLDPSIPNCIAANVQQYLNIRSEPNVSARPVGRLTSGEQTSTTGMRLRDFIEINNPVNGWVNKNFIRRCISKLDQKETPTPTPTPTPSNESNIPRETSTPTSTPTSSNESNIPREISTPTPTPTSSNTPDISKETSTTTPNPSDELSPLLTSKQLEQPPQPRTEEIIRPWSSEVVNEMRLIIEKVQKTDGILRIYMKAENQTSQDKQLDLHFNKFYVNDNLGNAYEDVSSVFGGTNWRGIVPGSGVARGYVVLTPTIDTGASTITVNFGDYPTFSGGKLSVVVPIK
nr:AAA family ATPase [Scytonema sp. UIC 10036]